MSEIDSSQPEIDWLRVRATEFKSDSEAPSRIEVLVVDDDLPTVAALRDYLLGEKAFRYTKRRDGSEGTTQKYGHEFRESPDSLIGHIAMDRTADNDTPITRIEANIAIVAPHELYQG